MIRRVPGPWLTWAWRATVFALLGVVALVAMHPFLQAGPAQPVPFSHGHHADDMDISCFFCHDGADRSQVAGMPSVHKCLLCHDVLLRDFPPLKPLHEAAQSGKTLQWVRVYKLSDYVFFNHERHVREGIDCGHCHGDVKGMERIVLNENLTMGFCVDCHREHKESVDCWLCHR